MSRKLKFFNLDLHVSVIADIKHILESMGHEVVNWSISGHHWLFGWDKRDDCVVNSSNWTHLDKAMCDRFYETYKDELADVDAFIVTHTPSFALLYEKFNKPIIVVASTRYEAPFTNDMMRWAWLNRYLQFGVKLGKIIPVANNKYDQEYLRYFTGIKAQHIPSLCEYTEAQYTGNASYALWNSRWKQNLICKGALVADHIVDKDAILERGHSWQDVADFHAAVHVPYNASTMSIFEQYTANVPLLFPTPEFMVELMEQDTPGVMTELSYNQIFGLGQGSAIPNCGFNDPNRYNDIHIMKQWILLADFYDRENMPDVLLFKDLDHMLEIICNTDMHGVSERMAATNVKRKKRVYDAWRGIISQIV